MKKSERKNTKAQQKNGEKNPIEIRRRQTARLVNMKYVQLH